MEINIWLTPLWVILALFVQEFSVCEQGMTISTKAPKSEKLFVPKTLKYNTGGSKKISGAVGIRPPNLAQFLASNDLSNPFTLRQIMPSDICPPKIFLKSSQIQDTLSQTCPFWGFNGQPPLPSSAMDNECNQHPRPHITMCMQYTLVEVEVGYSFPGAFGRVKVEVQSEGGDVFLQQVVSIRIHFINS